MALTDGLKLKTLHLIAVHDFSLTYQQCNVCKVEILRRSCTEMKHCVCLLEETVGPYCLVSMPGEVKDPTQGVNV